MRINMHLKHEEPSRKLSEKTQIITIFGFYIEILKLCKLTKSDKNTT